MDTETLKENLGNMAGGSQSRTPQAALDHINKLENVLHRLAYWFNTDQEILDSMSPNERADHVRQHKMILDALYN